VRQKFRLDSCARIADDYADLSVTPFQAQLDEPANWGKFDRVREKIADHLLQSDGVAGDHFRLEALMRAQFDAFGLRRRAHHVEGVGENGHDFGWAHVEP
jgi:hypothetical protein